MESMIQTLVVPACEVHIVSLQIVPGNDCSWTGPFNATVKDTTLNAQLGTIGTGSHMRLEQGTYELEWPVVCDLEVTPLVKIINNSVEICNPPSVNQRTDVEFICNEATGVYDRIERFYENSVFVNEIVTPTEFTCTGVAPDFEQVSVCLNGTIRIITNQIDPDGTVTQISDIDTGTPCNVSASDFITVCGCDDVNGDMTQISTYVSLYVRAYDGANLTSNLLGTFTDASAVTPYTPINPIDCDSIGSTVVSLQGRVEISDGNTWAPNSLISSYSVVSTVVADPNLPPTYTDSFGNVTPLPFSVEVHFTHDNIILDTAPIVTTNTGDTVIVTYLQKGA